MKFFGVVMSDIFPACSYQQNFSFMRLDLEDTIRLCLKYLPEHELQKFMMKLSLLTGIFLLYYLSKIKKQVLSLFLDFYIRFQSFGYGFPVIRRHGIKRN